MDRCSMYKHCKEKMLSLKTPFACVILEFYSAEDLPVIYSYKLIISSLSMISSFFWTYAATTGQMWSGSGTS